MSEDSSVVVASPDVLAALVAAFEGEAPGGDLLAYTASLGVTPPDDRSGWDLVYEWGPNGADLGLHWYQPSDDPQARIDEE